MNLLKVALRNKIMHRHETMARQYMRLIKGNPGVHINRRGYLNIYDLLSRGGGGPVYNGMLLIPAKDTRSGVIEVMYLDGHCSSISRTVEKASYNINDHLLRN